MSRVVILAAVMLCTTGAALLDARAATPLWFGGTCDASAAVALDNNLVAVADDENNSIRVYSRHLGGLPIHVVPLSHFLQVNPKSPEADLEGAARLGDRIYWISSHGRNARGRPSPNRGQLFATTGVVTNGNIELQPVGEPCHRLLADLFAEPRLARFDLCGAAKLAPKRPGALNIEGLAATPHGQLLIGFRNPVPHRKALIVPIQNPEELTALEPVRFGDPVLLDLGGLGIRSMDRVGDRYLIIAGPYDDGGVSRLFEWRGGEDQPRLLEAVDFHGLNPEAITVFPGHNEPNELFITSDDGTLSIDGKPCKDLKDPGQKCFRAISIVLPGMPL